MKIEVANGVARVYTPYNSNFVAKVKGLGGAKWDGASKTWTVPESAVNAVREIMMEVYGETDIPSGEKVSVRLTAVNDLSEWRGDVNLLGKCLCHASGRDSGGRPGDDVFYIFGKPVSGGSMKNWQSIVPAGSVMQIANVSKALLDKLEPSDDFTMEIMEDGSRLEHLRKEREALVKRLAEIDAELATVSEG